MEERVIAESVREIDHLSQLILPLTVLNAAMLLFILLSGLVDRTGDRTDDIYEKVSDMEFAVEKIARGMPR